MKRCPRCQLDLPTALFGRNRTTRDGLTGYCRHCQTLANRTWRAKHPDKALAANAARRMPHGPCLMCGKLCARHHCSDECRRKARALRMVNWRQANLSRARRRDRERTRRRTDKRRSKAAGKRAFQAVLRSTKTLAKALNRAYARDLRRSAVPPLIERLPEYRRRAQTSPKFYTRQERYAEAKALVVGSVAVAYEHCAYSKCKRLFVHPAWREQRYCRSSHANRAGKRRFNPIGMTRRQVYARDGWRCHVCGRKVPDQKYTAHDLDPTLDHLVPVEDGGSDHASNLALAHNKCNWDRGSHGPAQLRLIA